MVILGIFLGACVCVFGMWAFLKGQATMRAITQGGAPALFRRPAPPQARSEDLSQQLGALIREPGRQK